MSNVYSAIKSGFTKHYYHDAHASTVHLSPTYLWGNKSQREVDLTKEAIDQTVEHFLEAWRLELDTIEKTVPRVTLIYPVIVLNGRLMTYEIGGDVQEVDHVLYLFEFLANEPTPIGGRVITTKPIVIDIVSLSYFSEFLSLVQTKGVL